MREARMRILMGVALTAAMMASNVAAIAQPPDLRHACASTQLNAGVPATEIAARLGHSVEVLMNTYAHCIVGGAETANAILDAALGNGRLLAAERTALNIAADSTGEPREGAIGSTSPESIRTA